MPTIRRVQDEGDVLQSASQALDPQEFLARTRGGRG
jgi:hypothetical protein